MRPSLLWVIVILQVLTLVAVMRCCQQTARLADQVDSLPTASEWTRISDMVSRAHGVTQMRIHDWLFPEGQAH